LLYEVQYHTRCVISSNKHIFRAQCILNLNLKAMYVLLNLIYLFSSGRLLNVDLKATFIK